MFTDGHASGEDLSLADALRCVVEKLEELCERLPPTVATQAEGVKQGGCVHDTTRDKSEPSEGEAWDIIKDTLKQEEQVLVESWKDELNNLLVFAGLFSAVVTAFAVESYTWLQQDPGDASNLLLAYISLQLSSFTNTVGFMNSSVPALPLQNVTASFVPPAIAVPVNTLWVLSLTLSLMSAFLAIAVQQWLRNLRLPADIPVHQAVRLLSLRSDGLKTWQVPGIISLLPLLLQIAVVFFLIGLFVLLRSLNTAVTIAFGTVTLFGLTAFLVSTVIPLFSPWCPYKSPFIPTVLIVLQWLSYPLALITAMLLLPINDMLRSNTGRYIIRGFPSIISGVLQGVDSWYRRKLLAYIRSFHQHMLVDLGHFWLRHEYDVLAKLQSGDSSQLLPSLLAPILLKCSYGSFKRLLACLGHFSADQWRRTYRTTIDHSLKIFVPEFDCLGSELSDDTGNILPEAAPKIRKWLSFRRGELVWKAQDACEGIHGGRLAPDDIQDLGLLSELRKYEPSTAPRYMKHLFHICANQRTSDTFWPSDILPLKLILKALSIGYVPEKEDARKVVIFATKLVVHDSLRRSAWDADAHHTLFTSCTTALVAMLHRPSIMQDEGRFFISKFADILHDGQWKHTHKRMLAASYEDDTGVSAFREMPFIHRTLCDTLMELGKKNVLLQDPACPSIRLVSPLREIYNGINKWSINVARDRLHKFVTRSAYGDDNPQWAYELWGAKGDKHEVVLVSHAGNAGPANSTSPQSVHSEVVADMQACHAVSPPLPLSHVIKDADDDAMIDNSEGGDEGRRSAHIDSAIAAVPSVEAHAGQPHGEEQYAPSMDPVLGITPHARLPSRSTTLSVSQHPFDPPFFWDAQSSKTSLTDTPIPLTDLVPVLLNTPHVSSLPSIHTTDNPRVHFRAEDLSPETEEMEPLLEKELQDTDTTHDIGHTPVISIPTERDALATSPPQVLPQSAPSQPPSSDIQPAHNENDDPAASL